MGQKSAEIRKLIINDVQNGVKYREIAVKYEISIGTV